WLLKKLLVIRFMKSCENVFSNHCILPAHLCHPLNRYLGGLCVAGQTGTGMAFLTTLLLCTTKDFPVPSLQREGWYLARKTCCVFVMNFTRGDCWGLILPCCTISPMYRLVPLIQVTDW